VQEASLLPSPKKSEPVHDKNDEGTSSSQGFAHTDQYARYLSADGMGDHEDDIISSCKPPVPVCVTAFLVLHLIMLIMQAATAGDFIPSLSCL
jgi:hypothetical protein